MNYIILEKNHFTHFFYLKNKGICYQTKEGVRWSSPAVLYDEGFDGFSVFYDRDFTVHLLCTNKRSEIVYFIKKNDIWNKFILSPQKEKLIPMEFKICEYNNFLSFFYSAAYKSSIILIHCILNSGAMPEVISGLCPSYPYFNTNAGKVYFTTANNVLGYKSFIDGKCDIFSPVSENAFMPYSTTVENTDYIVYKKNNKIFLNNNEIISDSFSSFPVIQNRDNKLYVLWKSNSFVRYITSFNQGATWSAPMRFISSGYSPEFFLVKTSEKETCFFGHNSKSGPVLYGNSNFSGFNNLL